MKMRHCAKKSKPIIVSLLLSVMMLCQSVPVSAANDIPEITPSEASSSVSEDFKSKSIEEYEEIVSGLSAEMDPVSGTYILNFSPEEQYALEQVIDHNNEAYGPDDEVLYSSAYKYNTDFFYSQLNTTAERNFYLCLKSAFDSVLSSTKDYAATENSLLYVDYITLDSSISTARANYILKGLYYENPQYYFLTGYAYPETTVLSSYAIAILPDFRLYSSRVKAQAQIDSYALPIISQANTFSSDVDKEAYIAETLCNDISYNYSKIDGVNQTIAGAFIDNLCVCNGFTMATTYLLNAVGIEAFGVTSDSPHAWNRVCVDNIWYVTDTTWMNSDTILYDNVEDINYNYFNKSSATILGYNDDSRTSHTITPAWNTYYTLPVCSTDYKTSPAAPTGVKAEAVGNSIKVSWTPVSDAEWYRVYYVHNSGNASCVGITKTNSYTMNDLVSGDTYFYWIMSCSKGGLSDFSSNVYAIASDPVTKTLSAPQNLRSESGLGTITIYWDPVDDADGYNVYQVVGTSYYYMDEVSSKYNGIIYSNLKNTDSYSFVVTAFNDDGESDYSSVITASPLADKDVTVDMVNDMTIDECISWVNDFTSSSDEEIILTEAQLLAIERVLAYDYAAA